MQDENRKVVQLKRKWDTLLRECDREGKARPNLVYLCEGCHEELVAELNSHTRVNSLFRKSVIVGATIEMEGKTYKKCLQCAYDNKEEENEDE